jgi:ABC-type oligopeptide transport system substrate-binding subunit
MGRIVTTESKSCTRRLTPGEPVDIGVRGWSLDYLDPQDFLNYQFESRFRGADGFNEAHFSDPTWDRRLQAAARLSRPGGLPDVREAGRRARS